MFNTAQPIVERSWNDRGLTGAEPANEQKDTDFTIPLLAQCELAKAKIANVFEDRIMNRLKTVSSTSYRAAIAAGFALLFLAAGTPAAAVDSREIKVPIATTSVPGGATDISAARRRRVYSRGGSAAGLAFMGLAIGTMGAIVSQQRRNDYYSNGYGYGYAPGYYGGGPYYGNGYYRR